MFQGYLISGLDSLTHCRWSSGSTNGAQHEWKEASKQWQGHIGTEEREDRDKVERCRGEEVRIELRRFAETELFNADVKEAYGPPSTPSDTTACVSLNTPARC